MTFVSHAPLYICSARIYNKNTTSIMYVIFDDNVICIVIGVCMARVRVTWPHSQVSKVVQH